MEQRSQSRRYKTYQKKGGSWRSEASKMRARKAYLRRAGYVVHIGWVEQAWSTDQPAVGRKE